jgi:alkyl sulfatase BDS1-like metallo-beta-lactamase superfamily hydrolase
MSGAAGSAAGDMSEEEVKEWESMQINDAAVALEKEDYRLAAETLQTVLERNPEHRIALSLLASGTIPLMCHEAHSTWQCT